MTTTTITNWDDLQTGDLATFRFDNGASIVAPVHSTNLPGNWAALRFGTTVSAVHGTRESFRSATREVPDDKFKPGDRVNRIAGPFRQYWRNARVLRRKDWTSTDRPQEAYEVQNPQGTLARILASDLELAAPQTFKTGDKVEIR